MSATVRAQAPFVNAITNNSGIAPVTTQTTLEVGHVIVAEGAGGLLDASVTNTGTAGGYLFVLNSGTVPANGTLGAGVILDCAAVPAASTRGISYGSGIPLAFDSGATLCFSSSAPPVFTGAAAWFSGRAR